MTRTLQSICQIGSSPRVWGQDCCKYNFNPILRIIPTRVGTSIISFRPEGRERDHPHACGDKFEVFPLVSLSIGSSPRVWGQAEGVPSRFIVYRIIPTRVGTSIYRVQVGAYEKDHPHACGDKKKLSPVGHRHLGSSPRVWGQVDADFTVDLSDRIIPTRVGTSNECR